MKKIFFLIFFVLALVSFVYAANQSRIELTDGSTVEGEIVSFSEGQYTIKSSSLGDLKIEGSKVRSVRNAGQPAGFSQKDIESLDAATVQEEVRKLQPKIMGNPDIMKSVAGLISNPDFRDLLKDPEILNAAKSLDIKTLMANEKFVNVINDPTIKEIIRKVEEKKVEKSE
jgi:hypothetical protein